MGQGLPYTDVIHRQAYGAMRLSSLTPEEHRDLVALLALLGARINGWDEGANHVVLDVDCSGEPFESSNVLRIPVTATIDELINWARLLKTPVAR